MRRTELEAELIGLLRILATAPTVEAIIRAKALLTRLDKES